MTGFFLSHKRIKLVYFTSSIFTDFCFFLRRWLAFPHRQTHFMTVT